MSYKDPEGENVTHDDGEEEKGHDESRNWMEAIGTVYRASR